MQVREAIVKRGRMQCKDIPNELVIRAVLNTRDKTANCSWRMWHDVLVQFDLLMPDVPRPLFYAKVDKMREVHACVHSPYNKGQCRGDVHLAIECVGC